MYTFNAINMLHVNQNITLKVIEALKHVVDLGPRPAGSQANQQAANIIKWFSHFRRNCRIFVCVQNLSMPPTRSSYSLLILRGRLDKLSSMVDNETLKAIVDIQVGLATRIILIIIMIIMIIITR